MQAVQPLLLSTGTQRDELDGHCLCIAENFPSLLALAAFWIEEHSPIFQGPVWRPKLSRR